MSKDVDARESDDGGGVVPMPEPRKRKRKPASATTKGRPRTLMLSDEIYTRLQILALLRKKGVSEVLTGILERELPVFEVKRLDSRGSAGAA